MSRKSIELIYNKTTGKMERYDPTYDITIHCKTSEEKERVEKILASFRWIPVSERLPETTDPVNITWVNHDPEVYYSNIKDKPFTATACFCNGKWWWYSAVCQDYLDEYGKCDMDQMDDAIEVTAWKPLPDPYEEKE